MSCKEIDRLYAIGCYPVLVRLCKTGCGTAEVITKATIIHDYGGVLVQGTDITLAINDYKELDPSQIDKVSTAQTLVMSGTNTIKAPFIKVLVRNTSAAGTSITVNGGTVHSGESKSYSLDYFAEYTNDLVIVGGNYEVEVTKRALLPCLKDDVVAGSAVGAMTVVDVAANDTLCAGETKTYSIVGTPSNATVVNNNNGTFNVTPTASACGGSWSFAYQTSCSSGSATATVTGQIPSGTSSFSFEAVNAGSITIQNITTSDGSPYTVNWGDGTTTTHNSNTQAVHPYAANYTGAIVVSYASCAAITRIDVANQAAVKFTDSSISALSKLKRIYLSFTSSIITDTGLIGKNDIQEIILSSTVGTLITDIGLAGKNYLTSIYLGSTSSTITDVGLYGKAALVNLYLDNTASIITDAGLLNKNSIVNLYLNNTASIITDAGLQGKTLLSTLSLSNTASSITDAGLLDKTVIYNLSIASTLSSITNAGLANKPNLTILNLYNTSSSAVTGAGLASKPNLSIIYLGALGLSQSAVDNILSTLVATNTSNRRLDLRFGTNAAPSTAGIADKTTLVNRGWLNLSNPATTALTN
ncbi:MAG: leucine-rich repeat domain-containing protein [Thiothrix sp.]|nr:MAG: leucine-rich repeat domain-containing protein [Thiothrix sp.]